MFAKLFLRVLLNELLHNLDGLPFEETERSIGFSVVDKILPKKFIGLFVWENILNLLLAQEIYWNLKSVDKGTLLETKEPSNDFGSEIRVESCWE